MNAERAAIARKLRALREKTTAQGCTEAEAMQAAELYTRLVNKYDMTMTDIEIGEQTVRKVHIDTTDKKFHPIQECLTAMAILCDCKTWTNGPRRVVALGLPEDVAAFQVLYTVIRNALDLEWFKADMISSVRYERLSFQEGMASTIKRRLQEIHASKQQQAVSTGRDLVPVKMAAVHAEFKSMGIHLTSRRTQDHYGASRGAGRAAGERVGLNERVGEGRRITHQ
ncbi:hypothetical protein CMI37_30320 [Candidatus Pacearchaeota archaeon]|nr:hypothetical protein [Candidatus Pacearchaeota archaeon]|tara:strand:- start:436 stop:1113 length:678 start_codon:yes stop_codon:yes gene_type:complete